jgi:hypothetical protein
MAALDKGELTLLDALAAGATLDKAAEAALNGDHHFDLQASLLRHLQLGSFMAFNVDVSGEQRR